MKLTGIAADNWEGEVCDNCGYPYDDDYRVPDEVWEQIHERAPAGLLCMECTEAKAKEIGISLAWDGYYVERGEKLEDDKVISSYRIVDERILLLKSQLTDLQQRHDDMTAWSITQEKLIDKLKQKLITLRKENKELKKQALELHKAGTDAYEIASDLKGGVSKGGIGSTPKTDKPPDPPAQPYALSD